MSGAGAILRWHLSTMPSPPPRSPLSRSAGEGPGVRATRSAGEGPGVRATLTFSPTPVRSHRGRLGGRAGWVGLCTRLPLPGSGANGVICRKRTRDRCHTSRDRRRPGLDSKLR